jgi:hypothetical protein
VHHWNNSRPTAILGRTQITTWREYFVLNERGTEKPEPLRYKKLIVMIIKTPTIIDIIIRILMLL